MKLCECGCGQPTLLAQESRTNRGHVKGIPLRFIHGHQSGPPQRRRDWPAEIVAFLVREKRAGREFEESWQRAVKAHPPRSRDMGDAEPTLFGAETSVFEFLHEASWAAWHDFTSSEPGQGKALGRFRVDMLASWGDSSEPAARMARAA